MAALAVSGLPTAEFRFVAFLPRRASERRAELARLANETATLVFLEAPHRLKPTLAAMIETLGDRRVAVCRELTKLHEEVFRGSITVALAHFIEPRGEFVLVVAGAKEVEVVPTLDDEVRGQLLRLKNQGLAAKEATARLAASTGLSRRKLYGAWLKLE
jgi:16S rRNA (cytidine1402-2'-O)-methyltransferase